MITNILKNLYKNRHILLTVGSIVGTATTAHFYAKTKVRSQVIKNDCRNRKEELSRTWKMYILPVGLFALTSALIITNHQLHKAEYKKLIAAYSGLGMAFQKYRQTHTKDLETPVDDYLKDTSKTYLFYEPITQQKFYLTKEEMVDASTSLNRLMMEEGSCSLNYLLTMFNLNSCHLGDSLGWNIDIALMDQGYAWIEIFLDPIYDNGQFSHYNIVYDVDPQEGYEW